MPKKPRKQEETQAIKDKILDEALLLIREFGLDGFSMRNLADRLGIQAPAIYYYFANKDEIYVEILTRGFQALYRHCKQAQDSKPEAKQRFLAMIEAYVEFGITKSHFYDLMYTWHVPKYNDYVGTPIEPAAERELKVALTVGMMFVDSLRDVLESEYGKIEEDLRPQIVYFWSTLHGYIAGINNGLLNYLYNDALSLKSGLLEHFRLIFEEWLMRERERRQVQ